jgi:hypothetical protein
MLKKKLHEPHFPLFIHGHKICIFCLMPFGVREGIDMGVWSYWAGGLVTLGVPQNRRRKVVTLETWNVLSFLQEYLRLSLDTQYY